MCEAADGKRARPAREGSLIFTAEGEQVGTVTSGVQSPCLKKPIGMAYVQSQYQPAGSELLVAVSDLTFSGREKIKAGFWPVPCANG